MKFNFLFLLTTILFLSGCISVSEVEIKKQSVKYIKRANIDSFIGDDVNLPLVSKWTSGDFIVVELTSSENLAEFVRKHEANLFVDMHFCVQPKLEVLLGVPDVYWGAKSIIDLKLSDGHSKESNGQNKYEVVIFSEWNKKRKLPESSKKVGRELYYLEYDLDKEPKDICLSLKGGNVIKAVRSNQIKLTATEIEEVIRESK